MGENRSPSENRSVFDSPVGPLTLVERGSRLVAVRFGSDAPEEKPPTDLLAEVGRQLSEYFEGARRRFELPLDLAGSPFQRRVWAALRTIPYGETVSYGELARQIGAPGEAREVGGAVGR